MSIDSTGTIKLAENATLAIWEHEDGYYWLIDVEGGEREANVGPFETVREAEEDARAWWANQHASEEPLVE
jgi:hypothetical protein